MQSPDSAYDNNPNITIQPEISKGDFVIFEQAGSDYLIDDEIRTLIITLFHWIYSSLGKQASTSEACNYYLLTGCKARITKYKPKAFHTARACEGC